MKHHFVAAPVSRRCRSPAARACRRRAARPRDRAGASAAPVPPEIPVALLVDLSSGQTLFAREADRRFVPASVTKVMTAYTAFELIEQGKLSPEQR